MVNRKKRLQKGIASLEKQIKLHEDKLKRAEKEDNIELAAYYKKEITAKTTKFGEFWVQKTNRFSWKKDKEEKQRILDKGG